MRKLFWTVLLLFPAFSVAADDIDPKDIELSKEMEKTVARGELYAAAHLSISFKRFSGDEGESILIAGIGETMKRLNAEARAGKVYGYLAADLNWDGRVTRDELELYLANQDPGFVEGYLRDGDLDGDGVIHLSEMLEDARIELPDTEDPDRGDIREMLTWDLNQDGVLSWTEVLSVVSAKQ